ncbi:MAG: hypothetical protein COB50_00215, partial [Thiotrichales bacterium]
AMEQDEFLKEIQKDFGDFLGNFINIGKRNMFPLKLTVAKQQHVARVLLLGNAAHNLHPVAGQNFNLTIRDIESFIHIAKQRMCHGTSKQKVDEDLLSEYVNIRLQPQQTIINTTHIMLKMFANDKHIGKLLRHKWLGLIENIPALKSALNSFMLGIDADSKAWYLLSTLAALSKQ